MRTGDPWRVRVFPNKYPPVEGAEVIVESPVHDDTFHAIAHAEEVVRTYADRYRAHERAAYVSIFKNEGTRAGASIPHIHSQVVPLPFVPPRIARESAAFAQAPHCPLCRPEGNAIAENESFLWLTPATSAMPYQQWIVPRRHVEEISRFTGKEQRDLAEMLHAASAATSTLSPAFNWMLMNFPRQRAAHFYIDLFPRLTVIAGFELGTGTFIEIVDPADAARRVVEASSRRVVE